MILHISMGSEGDARADLYGFSLGKRETAYFNRHVIDSLNGLDGHRLLPILRAALVDIEMDLSVKEPSAVEDSVRGVLKEMLGVLRMSPSAVVDITP